MGRGIEFMLYITFICLDHPLNNFELSLLQNYKLDFVQYSSLWGGAVATIVGSKEDHVWGAVWKLKNDNLVSLDRCVRDSDRKTMHVCIQFVEKTPSDSKG